MNQLKYELTKTVNGIPLIEEVGKVGIKILIFLARRQRAKLTDFRKVMGAGYEGIYSSLYKLRELGLIEEERERNTRYFMLTKDGRKIAELLEEADRLLANIKKSRASS